LSFNCRAVGGANVPLWKSCCRHLSNNIEPPSYGNDALYVELL